MKTTSKMHMRIGLTFLVIASVCCADSWGPASVLTISSTNGDALVRVGLNELYTPPIALVYDYDAASEKYTLHSKFPLRNHIRPYLLAVAPAAKRIVAVEEWGGLGYGRDAIAVYDKDGKVLWRWSLKDLFSSEEMSQLPRSTSSIWWVESVTIAATANGGYAAMISPVLTYMGQSVKTVYTRLLVDLDTGKLTRQ